MSDPANPNAGATPPEPRQDNQMDPVWNDVGRTFWIVLFACIIGGLGGIGGVIMIIAAVVCGGLFVAGFALMKALDRQYGLALAVLVVGALALAAAGFVGTGIATWQFARNGLW